MRLFSFLQRLRATTPSAIATRLAAIDAEVGRLSPTQAQSAAEGLLARGAFRVTPGAAGLPAAGPALPADVATVFGRHASLSLGGMQLDRTLVAPWARAPGYLRIGTDMEHADVVFRLS